jgi:hypothetical protein
MNPKTQAARIAHTVGESKRVQILDLAKKANIRVLNPGLKKAAEAAPEVVAEPTAPTEPTTPTEPTAEATAEAPPTAVEVAQPETEVKEPQTTKEPAKKRGKSKGSKEKSKK